MFVPRRKTTCFPVCLIIQITQFCLDSGTINHAEKKREREREKRNERGEMEKEKKEKRTEGKILPNPSKVSDY